MSSRQHSPASPTETCRVAIVVVDLVESVKLIERHEADVVDRWRRFVEAANADVLPPLQGRMVKSLGDGMLLVFHDIRSAVKAALGLRTRIEQFNVDRPVDARLLLRTAVHVDEAVVDKHDIYGHGVNLCARLTSLALPGEIVLSSAARDELVPGLDAEVEDLGECHLKHVEQPVRAFRITQTRADPAKTWLPTAVLTASIAVIPLTCRSGSAQDAAVGDIVADTLIHQLSKTPDLTVLSRLSTSSLRDRDLRGIDFERSIGARFVLSGSYMVDRGRLVALVELASARGHELVWTQRVACSLNSLLGLRCESLQRLAHEIHHAILEREAQQVAAQPLPNLESFSLLYGGIGLLHRSSAPEFTRARQSLAELTERVPRHSAAHAWLAKWHCLRIIRGWAGADDTDAKQAQWRIRQALDRDPDSSLAWALNALVQSWVARSVEASEQASDQSLARNPNEALGWLFRCSARSWQGDGPAAAKAAERALALSKLDPMRYYYETLAAAGLLANGQPNRAVELCIHSLRLNRLHTPTHRVLAISQVMLGCVDDARTTIAAMLELQPGYTVDRFLRTYPGARQSHTSSYAEALREAGLPVGP